LTKAGLIETKYGLLDPSPTTDQAIVTRNFGRGPGNITVNLRVTKLIEFGGSAGERAVIANTGPGSGAPRPAPGVFNPAGGAPASSGSGRRYSLSISMSIRNLLNHTNPGPIIGNITSPLFGQAKSAGRRRRIRLFRSS
jgi:hypothetical protein